MLIFRDTNIYELDKTLRFNYLPYAKIETIMPFQFHSSVIGTIDYVYLQNTTETYDITSDITIKKYKTSLVANGAWYVYYGNAVAKSFPCGTFQLKIRITNTSTSVIYYSNFFKIENYDFYYLKLGNTFDFNGLLYGTLKTYYELAYLKPFQIRKIEPFIFEEAAENGDGTQKIIYQNLAEQYQIKCFCDKNQVEYYEKLSMYDDVYLYTNVFDTKQVFERLTVAISYNETFRIYEVIITVKINNIDKSLCQLFTDVKEFTTLGEIGVINDGGDAMKINTNDFLLIN